MTPQPDSQNDSAAPVFVLSGPDGTLIADTADTRYRAVAAARAALESGSAQLVVGALPFDPSDAAALMAPGTIRRLTTVPDWPEQLPQTYIVGAVPSLAEHRDRIGRAIGVLGTPGGDLRKVVLARGLQLGADAPVDPRSVLRRLVRADPAGYGYLVDLSAAGGRHTGATLVGASPELLVAREGLRVSCRPFAGSAPRSADPTVDADNGSALAASAKNRHEHQLVVDHLRAVLDPLCTELDVTPEPELSRTATVWHLSTRVSGRLRDPVTALDLAVALHPTPAVGGSPTREAVDLIREIEGGRGFYAGAVGWCDAAGDGRWAVSIRCAEIADDRCHALAHAGGGIVAESDADDELAETTTKFGTILNGFGIST